MRGKLFPSLLLAAAVAMASLPAASAGWLTRIAGGAAEVGAVGAKAGKLGIASLERAATVVKGLPATAKGAALAAHVTQEGHWKFVNRSGEVFTAGTPQELARAIPTLAPEVAEGQALALYLTEQTVFESRAALKDLPKAAELNVVVGHDSYKLIRKGVGATEALYAEVRPNIVVALTDPALFDEAVWQLARPLKKADVRVLSLEPGGPERLSAVPKFDPQTRAAVVDIVDPYKLPAALSSVRGQTVLVTGRVDGDVLRFNPPKGAESSIVLKDLTAAAEAADVNLVVLDQTAGRQPGGRNWLWQRVEVKGLDDALTRASFADFLNALGASRGQLAVTASAESPGRVLVQATPSGTAAVPGGGLGGGLTDWVGGFADDLAGQVMGHVTGHVLTTAVHAHMASASRQKELDARILPFLPSWVQIGYLTCLMTGILSWGVTSAWWLRIWPVEVKSEYAGPVGYNLARAARLLAFLLLFLPIAGPFAFLAVITIQVWEMMTAPFRLARWVWRKGTGAKAT